MASQPQFNIISNTPVTFNGVSLKRYTVTGLCYNWFHCDKHLAATAGAGDVKIMIISAVQTGC